LKNHAAIPCAVSGLVRKIAGLATDL